MYAPSNDVNRTACAPLCTPAWSRTSARRTPRHLTSDTRHPVTHWKSLVSDVGSIARRSSYEIRSGVSTSPSTRSDQSSALRRGRLPVTV